MLTQEMQMPDHSKKKKTAGKTTHITTNMKTETNESATKDTQTTMEMEGKEQQTEHTPTTDANTNMDSNNEEKQTYIATTRTEKKKRRNRPAKWIRDQQKLERFNRQDYQHNYNNRRQLPPAEFLWWLYNTFSQSYKLLWHPGPPQYGNQWWNNYRETTHHRGTWYRF